MIFDEKYLLLIIGAIQYIEQRGYDALYSKTAAQTLYKIGAGEYHYAISQIDKVKKYITFIDWRKINKLIEG